MTQIVHRDVKLENILLDGANRIKLIDFGLAANTMPGKKLKVHCGSPSYAAPEIVARRLYDGPPVDVWSLGVVLYGMICGHLPFHASDNKKVEAPLLCVFGTPPGVFRYRGSSVVMHSSVRFDLLRGGLSSGM